MDGAKVYKQYRGHNLVKSILLGSYPSSNEYKDWHLHRYIDTVLYENTYYYH